MLLFIVTLAVTLLVQLYLRRTYGKWQGVPSTAGLTGAETARAILDANNLQSVQVEAVPGNLSDHYDPRARVVRLSEANYQGQGVAGVAVAAHEVGHALQHAHKLTNRWCGVRRWFRWQVSGRILGRGWSFWELS